MKIFLNKKKETVFSMNLTLKQKMNKEQYNRLAFPLQLSILHVIIIISRYYLLYIRF